MSLETIEEVEEYTQDMEVLQKLADAESEQLELFAGESMEIMNDLADEFRERTLIEVEVLNEGTPKTGYIPVKAHRSDAGFDLYATEDVVFNQSIVTKHPLNIKLKLPKGTYAHIKGKSGLGSKGLCLLAEIVDEGYRGIPHIVATNLAMHPIRIKKGEKLAQMIIHPYSDRYEIVKVDKVEETTDRGSGGFGSTGKV